VVKAFEGRVGVLRFEVVAPAVLRRKKHGPRALESERANPQRSRIKSS
jgi:hypothetical protein